MKLVFVAFIIMIFCACNRGDGYSEYKKLVSKEKKAGKRTDDIFFGIKLGMTSKDFFTLCWKMNSKGIFTDGKSNTAVLYKMEKELKHPASMTFYPEMAKDVIRKMDVSFQYDGWAPWNKHLFADSLLQDVYHLYATKWHTGGNPFIKIEDANRGTLYIKVDGNRRIILAKKDDAIVKADYTDLLNEVTPNP